MATGGKKKKSGSKTKTPAKKTSTTAKKNEKQTSASKAGYVLVIMALLAAVLFMLNNYSFDNKKTDSPEIITPGHLVYEPDKDKESKKENKEDSIKQKEKKVEEDRKEKIVSKKVKIYLIDFNEKTEKTYLHPVFRTVSAITPVKSSIEELIKGPSSSEKKRGILTAVHSNTKIYDVTISGNTAILNFNSAIEYGASGNILLSRIDQIIYTATQFENIDNIIIKVNGKTRRFLGSDGIAVGGPLHRR